MSDDPYRPGVISDENKNTYNDILTVGFLSVNNDVV